MHRVCYVEVRCLVPTFARYARMKTNYAVFALLQAPDYAKDIASIFDI